ncbi:peptidoglycan editing factor PgeF [Chthonobacter rhizosphaerae]|uniref:peptidoglycan editing factor PgeF n=1 Tax=Chthonobacter rhizosphaerae TaxID=2735553 RepID=UPI0015EF7F84|nr:peptidoglycan editing factor PgeF [Chthonobacter rhizosphaerae]
MMVRSPTLSALPGVRHGWFTREGGVSDGIYAGLNTGLGSNDDQGRVRENRARIAAAMEVSPDRLVTCYQVHSPDVVVAETPWAPADNPKADALVTRVPDLAIAVSSADCGPVLFADGEAGVVGAAHSGWKGAFTGVLEATVDAMERLGADRGRIHAVVGPMISGEAYEVGPEFVARFEAAGEDVGRWFRPTDKAGHARFDLPAYIVHRLARAGIARAENLGLCTYADEDRFFSYRRMTHRGEADYGRHLSAIALTPR